MKINPYLPLEPLNKAIIGEGNLLQSADLKQFGLNIYEASKNPLLDKEINNHADLMGFVPENNEIFLSYHLKGETEAFIRDYNIHYIKNITSPYPNDCKLNIAFTGRNIICKSSIINESLLNYFKFKNIRILSTRQGYSKCSICLINENAIITEDDGIASLLNNSQYDVLLIKKGFVKLSDRHYGFIGGASAKLSNDIIYFSGDIRQHPDFDKIKSFLNNYNIQIIFNKNYPLTDFGGIIPIL